MCHISGLILYKEKNHICMCKKTSSFLFKISSYKFHNAFLKELKKYYAKTLVGNSEISVLIHSNRRFDALNYWCKPHVAVSFSLFQIAVLRMRKSNISKSVK